MRNRTKRAPRWQRIFLLLLTGLLLLGLLPGRLDVPVLAADDERIIVSLGDSYSAGEGIEPFYGQDQEMSEKVKDHDWLAHRSEESWPGRLTVNGRKMADYRDVYWYFTAVSGAVTADLQGQQVKEYDKDWSKYTGSVKLEPQLDIFNKLGDKKADYVTLTMGGNDAGFSKIITEAVTGSTYLNTSKLADKLNKTWEKFYKKGGIRDDLKQAYQDIAEKAGPQAWIIVAGYPKLVEQSGKGALISAEEAKLINEAVTKFNGEIKSLVDSCRESGMKICFVSVEEAFDGHEAFSEDPYINEVIFPPKSQDIHDLDHKDIAGTIASSYSIHPNKKGAKAYAKCVQKKLDELEAARNKPDRVTSDERDIVLVLDVSGSMAGQPMTETKKASQKFISTILKEDASIGIVTYDSTAQMTADFSIEGEYLTDTVEDLHAGGGTNIEAGLKTAEEMLSDSKAEKKIIVLMSDGMPNYGKVGDELIDYADDLKDDGIYIYTLGFFEDLGSGKSSAQLLMEGIASDGCHYEVADADNLVYFFGDVADQINGQKYIYVRIACPVDVTVTYKGQTLCSAEKDLNTRTDFGSLTFEESSTESSDSSDDRVKILRLKDGADYDIRIEGNGRGRMNYTIGFMDEKGEYSDLRKFTNIKISKRTVIDTVAGDSSSTVLKVDEDGDGKYDLRYKAKANARGELVDYTWLWILGAVAVLAAAAAVLVLKLKKRSKKDGK